MKIGWLVWEYAEVKYPVLMPEPPGWHFKAIQIVYAEIVEGE